MVSRATLPTPETLTVPRAAHILGIPVRTLYAHCESGTVPSVRISRRILILRSVVDALLESGKFTVAGDASW